MIEVATRTDVDCDADALERVLVWACGRLGIARATVGLMVVGEEEMAAINGEHRAKPTPTDVLAFPVDGPEVRDGWPDDGPPPELGDVVICPAAAEEPLTTLAIHGLLHLVGYDHEVDDGEMLALQDVLVAEAPA
ncbi:MAG: rRNA maturation RNase YbeY [Actinomycetota bacterium]